MNNGESQGNHTFDIVEVLYYGDPIEAARDIQDGTVYVSIRRVCENLGIDSDSHIQKLKDYHWATPVKIAVVAQDDKRRELAFLPLAQVQDWLDHIDPATVAEA
jgi:hypothetical protein